MPSRYCPACEDRYPCATSVTNCPVCNAVTSYDTRDPSLSKAEFDQLMWVKGKRLPKPLAEAEVEMAEREWSLLAREAARRGPTWSVADLIAEGFPSGQAAA